MKNFLRVVAGLLLSAVVGVAAFALWVEMDARAANQKFQKAKTHWSAIVDAEVPIGATRDQVMGWKKRRFPDQADGSDATDRKIDVLADKIPAGGLRFPCATWYVIIYLDFGDDDVLDKRSVTGVGACV